MKAIEMLALLLLGGQTPAGVRQEEVPRLILKLEKARAGVVRFTVTNVARTAVTVRAQAYAVLIGPSLEGGYVPRYWSELKVAGLPTSNNPLRLPAGEKASGELEIRTLQWMPERTGLFPERPLSRAVVPGEYRVQLQITDELDNWWRSNELPARVRPSGGVDL